jgi:type IV fimbrial biogenesis protein FimT
MHPMERETCQAPPKRPPFERGFSLMETLIVIAIVAVLMALAIPTFKFVTQSNRSTAEINGLLSNLQLARAEAIKEGQTVSLCPSVDGATCSGASNAWQSGWLVFSDTGVIGTVDGTDFIVRVQNAFTGNDTLQSDHNVSVITFSREGFAMNLPNAVTFTLHDSAADPQFTRCLSLTIVGALSTQIAGGQTAELVPCT